AECAVDAGPDVAGVALGAASVGRSRRTLCWAGRAYVGRAVSVYALHHPRVASGAVIAFESLRADHRPGDEPAAAVLLDVGGRGAGPADQGADCACVLLRLGDSVSAADRAV